VALYLLLYICKESSTNQPFFAKQTQFPPVFRPKTAICKFESQFKPNLNQIKPNDNLGNLVRRRRILCVFCALCGYSKNMIVNEIFYSIQGEGFIAGIPSVFIRLAGCPLSCSYCDTVYARDYNDGEELTAEQIIEKVKAHPARHAVVTGGEPLVEQDMSERQGLRKLLTLLKKEEKHITIETAGLKFLPHLPCDLMSISPKPPAKDSLNEIRRLIQNYDYQLKFVVANDNDLIQAEELLAELGKYDHDKVMLMPRAATREQYLKTAPMVAEMCKQTGLAFSPRLQILLWQGKKGF
jgi:7-carboxy-7-deazaguanine synthase